MSAPPRADARLVYDSRTAAKLLGISVSILNSWRQTGEGPDYIKVGTLVRYHPDDLQRWLAANRVARVGRQANRGKRRKAAMPPAAELRTP
jgi:hypothetical protein